MLNNAEKGSTSCKKFEFVNNLTKVKQRKKEIDVENFYGNQLCLKRGFWQAMKLIKMLICKGTFATLVLARAHLETAVSDLPDLKNDIELCLRAAKSNAFHLKQL